MRKIIIIGDSFALGFKDQKIFGLESDYLIKKFNDSGYNVIIDGQPSRDIQTIIDIWIKYLPITNEDDVFIIILPYFGRTRLPLLMDESVKHDNPFIIPNYFIGTKSYHQQVLLDFWLNNFDEKYFDDGLKIQEMINASTPSKINQIEIIESLSKITKSKKIILSWDYVDIKNEIIFDREKITKEINFWETLGDQYIKTNGQQGFENDSHWSVEMYEKIIEFIKEKLYL